MKKISILLLALSCWQLHVAAQLNYTYTQRLNTVFDSVCTRYHIKGATAAITVPGEGLWERAHGESYAGVPITTDMYMGIGSNTKTYFAVLMLKLQEQGKLDLDDTIGQWIQHPNIPGKITIRQLLNHTSGLYSFTNNSDINNYIMSDFTRIWPADSILNMVKAPVAAPGGAWDYCNTNYTLVGLIIRAVTGKQPYEVLRSEILTPQHLDETYFFPYEQPKSTIPHAWSAVLSPGNYMEDMIVAHNYSHNAMFSLAYTAGALMTTARDNAKFWDQLMSGQILSNASMAEMLTLVPIGSGRGYGLGIFNFPNYNGRHVVSHGGTNFGFINDNIHDLTSGVSIAVLTNQDSVSNNVLLSYVIWALHTVTKKYTDVASVHNGDAGVKVYPNPAKSHINIDVSQDAVMSLFDITGKKVKYVPVQQGTSTIDISELSGGTYYIDIMKDNLPLYRQTIVVTQ